MPEPEYPTTRRYSTGRTSRETPASSHVSAKSLWSGGVATMVVAAGVGIVCMLIIRLVLDIPVLAPGSGAPVVQHQSATVPIGAAVAALIATALLHLLLLTTPRPVSFFVAIGGLATAIMIVEVFLISGPWQEQVATAVMYAVIAVVTLSLLTGVARAASQRRGR